MHALYYTELINSFCLEPLCRDYLMEPYPFVCHRNYNQTNGLCYVFLMYCNKKYFYAPLHKLPFTHRLCT
jgi:hypothetical protein